jgi:hypothetical protein
MGKKVDVEVYEKTGGHTLQPHVGDELCGVNLQEFVHRFYFDN